MSVLPEIKRKKTEVDGESKKKPSFVIKANTKRGVVSNERGVTACGSVLCYSLSGFTSVLLEQFLRF